mgnify:CR=1
RTGSGCHRKNYQNFPKKICHEALDHPSSDQQRNYQSDQKWGYTSLIKNPIS